MRQHIKKQTGQRNSLRTTSRKIRFRWVLLLSVVIILMMAGFIFNKQKKIRFVSEYSTRMMTWISEHKYFFHHAHAEKKLAAKHENNDEPQMHFEFYTALPNMRVDTPSVLINEKHVEKSDNTAAKNITSKISKPEEADNKLLQTANAFVNPDDLEKEFAKTIKQSNYIVQIASFRNSESAEHLRQALIADGFNAAIVKLMTSNNPMYRVQLGPFSNRNQAKSAIKQLEKVGKYGILRKME